MARPIKDPDARAKAVEALLREAGTEDGVPGARVRDMAEQAGYSHRRITSLMREGGAKWDAGTAVWRRKKPRARLAR